MIEEKKKYERPEMTAIEIQTEAMLATSQGDEPIESVYFEEI